MRLSLSLGIGLGMYIYTGTVPDFQCLLPERLLSSHPQAAVQKLDRTEALSEASQFVT